MTREQFDFKTPELIKQLYDQALHVSKRTTKNALATMFRIELAFAKKTLLAWFNKKVSPPFKRLEQAVIQKYEKENQFCWSQERKCVICKLPMRTLITSSTRPDSEMDYGDYIARYEYKFMRNIYYQEQLDWSPQLKSLESYYEAFKDYIHHAIEIYRLLINYNMRLRDISIDVQNFIETNFGDSDLEYIKHEIMQTDIKNALKTCRNSIPKFRLKIYAYLYDELFCFPPQDEYDIVTTKKFFNHVHNQITMKVHLHHSHVTVEILGYAHDFCNKKVVEVEKAEIPCIAHNLFGFDFWYFMKGFSATSWCTKELSAGGTNLTNLNFANIRGEIKFIDSLKYYQRSLAELTSSMDEKEIEKARVVMDSFLKNHHYFSSVWPFLSPTKKEKILKITCEGKGVIPYEIVTGINSFFLKPENDFWSKTEFYSELKQKAVGDEEYEDSKFLYQTLKMRHLGDLNDLYNAQDVTLLSKLIENRFQFMQDKYGFNPRKCNSASSLSGCIEREMSKVIIAFPTTA